MKLNVINKINNNTLKQYNIIMIKQKVAQGFLFKMFPKLPYKPNNYIKTIKIMTEIFIVLKILKKNKH